MLEAMNNWLDKPLSRRDKLTWVPIILGLLLYMLFSVLEGVVELFANPYALPEMEVIIYEIRLFPHHLLA